MSVAFRRDGDEEHLEPKFEIPIPPGPNLVTPDGQALIDTKVEQITAAVAALVAAGAEQPQIDKARRDRRNRHAGNLPPQRAGARADDYG